MLEAGASALSRNGVSRLAVWAVCALAIALLGARHAALGPYLLLDTDLGWHLAYGTWILDHGRLPVEDTWSWYSQGKPYQLTQWGGQALLGLAAHAGGSGLNLAIACALSLMFGLCFAAIRPWLKDGSLAACIAMAVPLTAWAGPVRPVVFAWAMAAWLLLHACRLVQAGHGLPGRHLIGLGVVVASWANLHGSFVVGVGASLVCLVGLGVHRRFVERSLTTAQALQLAAAALLVLGATGLTPYGFGGWSAAWRVAGLQTTQYFIEWRPTTLLSGMGAPLLAVLAALLTLCWRRASPLAIAGSMLVLLFGMTAARNVVTASVFGTAFVALALRDTPIDRARPESRPAVALGGAVAGVLAVALWGATWRPAQDAIWRAAEGLRFPTAIADRMTPEERRLRLFAAQEEGGFWMQRGVVPMIDGRADLHGDLSFAQSLQVLGAYPGWQALLDSWKVESIVVKGDTALVAALRDQIGWELKANEGGFEYWRRASVAQTSKVPDAPPTQFNPLRLLRRSQ